MQRHARLCGEPVRAFVRVCVRACVRVCVHVCWHVCLNMCVHVLRVSASSGLAAEWHAALLMRCRSLLVPFMAQSLLMLERGDASAEDIDKAMQLGAGHPMVRGRVSACMRTQQRGLTHHRLRAHQGPLTLTDYVGLDVTLAILEGWKEQYPGEPAFVVPEMLRTMVKQGKLGRKTGEGFFKWEGNQRARS